MVGGVYQNKLGLRISVAAIRFPDSASPRRAISKKEKTMNAGMKWVAVVAVCAAACGKTSTAVSTPGGDIAVEQSGDQVTVTNEQTGQQVTAGNKVPENFPPEFVYAGSTGIANSIADNTGTFMVTFQTSDDPEKIMTFYKDAAAKSGWTVEATANVGGAQMLQAKKDESTMAVHIARGEAGQPTMVQVAIGKNQG
jgi:hypothetical protein